MANSAINISANAQEVINLRKRIDELKAALSSMRRSTDPAAYDKLNRELQTSSVRYNRLVGDIQRYTVAQQQAERAISRSSDSLTDLLKKGAALAGITFGAEKIRELGMEIIKVHGEMQQLDIAFTTMLKSQEKADALMSGLKTFATDTPFGLMDSAKGAKQLLAYGTQAENIIGDLKMLGNVASGVSAPLGDIVYLYGTLRSQGRAYAVDIRQFAGRGIPIYAELAKVLKVNVDQVNELVSAGKVGFPEVEQAFKNMTSGGGMFEGLMEKQTASVTGQIEKLKDNIQFMFDAIGTSSEGAIYGAIDGASTLVENYETVGKVLLGLIATYGAYKTAVILLSTVENIRYQSTLAQMAGYSRLAVITELLTAKTAALNKVLMNNAYAILAAAAVALAYGIYQAVTATSKLEDSQKRVNDITESFNASIENERLKLDLLFEKFKNAKKGTDEYKKAKDDIMSQAESYQTGLSKEIDLLNDVAGAYKAISAAALQSAKDRAIAKGTQSAIDAYTEEWGKSTSKIQKEFISKFGKEQGSLLLDSLKDSLSNGKELSKEVESAIKSFDRIIYSAQGAAATTQSYQYNPINLAIGNIRDSKKVLDQEREELIGMFGSGSSSGKKEEPTIISTYNDQLKSAQDNVSKLEKDLANLRKGIRPVDIKADIQFDFSKNIEEKAKELKDAQDKLSYLTTGQSYSASNKANNAAETAAEKARKTAQEIADQNEKIKQLVDKQGLERKRQNEDLVNQETQASISAMRSGAEKVKRQKELDNELEIQALERQKEDYIQKIIQNQREIFEAQEELKLKQDNKYVKKAFDPTSVKTDTSLFDSMIGYTRDSQQNKSFDAIDKAWNEYFIKFGNYQQKRAAIVEKYNKEIAEAQTGGDKAVLEKEMNNQLDELDSSVKNSTTLMGQLFADTSQKSVGEIQKIIDKAELLMQYIEAVKDGEGNAMIGGKSVSKDDIKGLGISENTINNLQLSTQELEALRNAINKLKGDLGGKSPFKLFETQIKDAYKSIKEGITSGDSKKIGVGISNIGGAIQEITPELKEFGNSMGQIFGEQTGDDINTIVDLLGNTAQIGQGVGKIMAGDVVGGIKDAITGIGNIFAMGSDASKRHKEALKQINQAVKAQEHAYQLALKLKSLEYEKGDTIFGDDPYGKAINAAKEYKDAIEDLKASLKGDGKLKQSGLFSLFNKVPKTSDYAALQNIDIVTGHKKTGLFGWGKGKDTYTGILTVYPELIDGQGKFNVELAKTILAERKMSEESKATVQQMIDNADAIEKAYSVMKDYLTDIFGDLGNSMTDALVSAFQKGEDASKAFYDSASGMIQNLVKDMINSAVIGPVIQKATEDAMKVMEDTSLTNEQRMDKLMSIVDNALEQGLAASDTAKDLYDYANKAWKDKTGKDFADSSTSQSSSYGTSTSMSQETGGAILGRLTGVHEELIRIGQNVGYIAQWNQPMDEKFNVDVLRAPIDSLNESCQRIELMIEENRNIALQTFYVVKDIKVDTSNLSEINEKLGRIESNTKAFKGK